MINYSEFLLEKRIGKLKSKIQFDITIDLIKTNHAEERQDFKERGLDVEDDRYISNEEIVNFIHSFKKEILAAMIDGTIYNRKRFTIKSKKMALAVVLELNQIKLTYWKLVAITVFRENEDNRFENKENDIVFEKE